MWLTWSAWVLELWWRRHSPRVHGLDSRKFHQFWTAVEYTQNCNCWGDIRNVNVRFSGERHCNCSSRRPAVSSQEGQNASVGPECSRGLLYCSCYFSASTNACLKILGNASCLVTMGHFNPSVSIFIQRRQTENVASSILAQQYSWIILTAAQR